MRRVFVARHPTEAHFVRALLDGEGITAEVRGEALFGVRGEVAATPETLPSVWIVEDRQFDSAMVVIGRYEGQGTSLDPKGPDWQCSKCGEIIESQFTACWRCGTAKPTSG
jgi:hypothetical protein